MKKTRNQMGITLVSLTIIIVILLILGSISMSKMNGQGILEHASNTKNAFEELANFTDKKIDDMKYFENLGDELIDDDRFPEYQPFITKWKTTTTNEEIVLPLIISNSYTYNCKIDYGDGTEVRINGKSTTDNTHTYAEPGEYLITITGICPTFDFSAVSTSATSIIGIQQWGKTEVSKISFSGCTNLAGSIPEPVENTFKNASTDTFR